MSRALAILTYNREDLFIKLWDSIDTSQFDYIFVIQDGGGDRYSDSLDSRVRNTKDSIATWTWFIDNRGVADGKQKCLDLFLEKDLDELFLLEDDVEITDNSVWLRSSKWSNDVGIPHWNWNSYRDTSERNVVVNHRMTNHDSKIIKFYNTTEASFSYFNREVVEQYKFDTAFYNCWEHIDLYLRMAEDEVVPPFWWFPQPAFLDTCLKTNGDVSTIDQPRIIQAGNQHWMEKWGKPVTHFHKEKTKEDIIKWLKKNAK